MRYYSILIFFIIHVSPDLHAQVNQVDSVLMKTEDIFNQVLLRNHDTTYIKSYWNELVVKTLGVSKYTLFELNDGKNNSSLRYRPDRQLNLGFGLAYKWFAVDLAFNVGLREQSNLENKYIDIQGRIFGSKHFMEGTYQYYFGYRLQKLDTENDQEFTDSPIRNDIRTINIALEYLYAFNYGEFSLKAPFVLNERQLKSAGSPIAGVTFNQYVMDADSSVIPSGYEDYFIRKMQIRDFTISTLSVNFGYMYSLVLWEKFFLTVSLIPGLGLNLGDYQTDHREIINPELTIRLRSMNTIGYNSRRFMAGVQAMSSLGRISITSNSGILASHGTFKAFVGYRFGN